VTQISPLSRRKFATLAADWGTIALIEAWFESEGFERDQDFEFPETSVRRALVDAYESRIDLTDPDQHLRLLRVYATAVEEVGRDMDAGLVPQAEALVKALIRDGASVSPVGEIEVPRLPTIATIDLDSYTRLAEPAVVRAHLRRIESGLTDDPAVAIGSSKELVESVCKMILDDRGVEYNRRDDLLGLYKKVSIELRLNADAVPDSARGSKSAQQALRAMVTTLQALAEMRNELGIGHGSSTASKALTRHAKLAFHCARGLAEFLLDTWHVRADEAN
jgi:hypothetical protein